MNHEKVITKKKLQLALEKLEKEDNQLLKQIEKLDNRTNTFLSISLGVFSLQITLLTSTIISIYEKYKSEQNILSTILVIFFISNIFLNMYSITNFRKSSKISETIYSDRYNINEFSNNNLDEKNLLKREIVSYQGNIYENERKINYKKKYINRGLNNIVIKV